MHMGKQQNSIVQFRTEEKIYRGRSAVEIVRSIEFDSRNYPDKGRSVRQFLSWSLSHLADRIPPREMDLSDRMEDEELALNYLCLRDEFGAGKLSIARGNRIGAA